MRLKTLRTILVSTLFPVSFFNVVAASDFDTMGVSLLRAIDPTLVGTGVKVAQPEAAGINDWQVNPATVNQPTSLFTYISSGGSSTSFPNALGTESGHANGVGGNFYGTLTGVAPGVNHVDNYEANYFYQTFIGGLRGPISFPAKIVNQSFVFTDLTVAQQESIDTDYDNHAAQFNTLFVSGADNGGPPKAPSTAYNGLSVGAFSGASSIGPTSDNGRSKPDITAPAGATSYSTPFVAGAAAVLVQAGTRGDGGPGTAGGATNIRTVKALLLNGAVKPSNWTHTATAPLDTRYGAGIVNVFNSYKQLAAGRFPFIESTLSSGTNHPPGSNSGNVASLVGWDTNSVTSTTSQDNENHYYFNLPVATARSFTLTSTLVWNRQTNAATAKNLNLFLYNTANGSLVASSVSTVDNVEHLYIPSLPAGRYDLQVWKEGGSNSTKGTEIYALAFESFALSLNIAKVGTNIVISWPLAPTGFRLESSQNLIPPISWSAVTNAVSITNNQNRITLPSTGTMQYFRLVQP